MEEFDRRIREYEKLIQAAIKELDFLKSERKRLHELQKFKPIVLPFRNKKKSDKFL